MARERDTTTHVAGESADAGLSAQAHSGWQDLGNAPVKVVTGHQRTSDVNFDLKPGAIVAHPRSTVIFVCG